jgi:hypothetical protein
VIPLHQKQRRSEQRRAVDEVGRPLFAGEDVAAGAPDQPNGDGGDARNNSHRVEAVVPLAGRHPQSHRERQGAKRRDASEPKEYVAEPIAYSFPPLVVLVLDAYILNANVLWGVFDHRQLAHRPPLVADIDPNADRRSRDRLPKLAGSTGRPTLRKFCRR